MVLTRCAPARLDTLGRTYSLAETAEYAFAEILAPLRRANGAEDPLAPIAEALGLAVDELSKRSPRSGISRRTACPRPVADRPGACCAAG